MKGKHISIRSKINRMLQNKVAVAFAIIVALMLLIPSGIALAESAIVTEDEQNPVAEEAVQPTETPGSETTVTETEEPNAETPESTESEPATPEVVTPEENTIATFDCIVASDSDSEPITDGTAYATVVGIMNDGTTFTSMKWCDDAGHAYFDSLPAEIVDNGAAVICGAYNHNNSGAMLQLMTNASTIFLHSGVNNLNINETVGYGGTILTTDSSVTLNLGLGDITFNIPSSCDIHDLFPYVGVPEMSEFLFQKGGSMLYDQTYDMTIDSYFKLHLAISLTPTSGYVFKEWLINGTAYEKTATMLGGDIKTIEPVFVSSDPSVSSFGAYIRDYYTEKPIENGDAYAILFGFDVSNYTMTYCSGLVKADPVTGRVLITNIPAGLGISVISGANGHETLLDFYGIAGEDEDYKNIWLSEESTCSISNAGGLVSCDLIGGYIAQESGNSIVVPFPVPTSFGNSVPSLSLEYPGTTCTFNADGTIVYTVEYSYDNGTVENGFELTMSTKGAEGTTFIGWEKDGQIVPSLTLSELTESTTVTPQFVANPAQNPESSAQTGDTNALPIAILGIITVIASGVFLIVRRVKKN